MDQSSFHSESTNQNYHAHKEQSTGFQASLNPNQPSNSSIFSLENDGTNSEDVNLSSFRQTLPNLNINPQLPIRNYEVGSQYMYRKEVYENVFSQLKDHNKAICYSNIWYNIAYLGNKYSKNVEDAVMKYAPLNFLPPKMPEYNLEHTQYNSYQNYDDNYYPRK